MKNYSLYLENENEKILLMKDTLINIDEITTSFKNKEKMVEILFRGKDFDYSKCSILIESSSKFPVDFIGSDFRDVIRRFNDQKYMNSVCSIDSKILLEYFEEKLNDVVIRNSRDLTDVSEKKEEYLKNNNIPIVQLIGGLKIMNLSKNAQTRGEKNTNNSLNARINVNHNIRKYNEKYKNYRDMYCYMVGISMISQEEPYYTKEERVTLKKFLDNASEKIDNMIYGKNQLTFNLELEEPKDTLDNEEDDEVVLDYIQKGARVK